MTFVCKINTGLRNFVFDHKIFILSNKKIAKGNMKISLFSRNPQTKVNILLVVIKLVNHDYLQKVLLNFNILNTSIYFCLHGSIVSHVHRKGFTHKQIIYICVKILIDKHISLAKRTCIYAKILFIGMFAPSQGQIQIIYSCK